MDNSVANIRRDYKLQSLNEADVKANPFEQFDIWFKQAVESDIDEVNTMSLATCTPKGKPSVRIVLLKDYSPGGFTFFTNYQSKKGNEISENPQAALCFFWKELERQIRIEGIVQTTSPQLSDEYFNSRPTGSKLGAWTSPQSQIIQSRQVLEEKEKQLQQEFANAVIKRPNHWGGYTLIPNYFEFWQGRSNRLHDRICFSLQPNQIWKMARLAP